MKISDETRTDDERLPHVSQALIEHLRQRRQWQDRCPEPQWDLQAVHRNIGANEVITHLEELLAQQTGL